MNELENHYSFQDLLDLQGRSMEIVNDIATRVGNLAKKVDTIEDSINNIQTDIIGIRENEEITTAQRKAIKRAVSNRVYTALGVPLRRADRTLEDKIVIERYTGLFYKRCYSDVQREGHLGNPYETTPKKEFDAAMKDIEAWRPHGGTEALKKEADEMALARKIAQEQGYR